jgi:S1-C subfamily serine protease
MMIGIPDVGMPVFAPGVVAPRSANGEPAVGVITAIRRDRGLTLIHSSIAGVSRNGGSPLLDPDGNVVGIGAAMPEAAPKTEDGSQAGSFFMPVKDALDGLGIVVERPTSPKPETPPGREVNAAPPLDLAIADGPGKTPVAGSAGARVSSEPAPRRGTDHN